MSTLYNLTCTYVNVALKTSISERSPDFGALFKNLEKKLRPVQFLSVAAGIHKRLVTNLKGRKSSRLSHFDRIRNLPKCERPTQSQTLAPLSEAQQNVERRRQQLEKWKEDKEKRKKELAAQKKKPFVTGVVHNPVKFVPPPPLKAVPSTSGRVTRSQAAKKVPKQKVDPKPFKASQSFAPKNASFRPPKIKNVTKIPKLAPIPKTREYKTYNFDFNIVPNNVPKATKSKSEVTQQTRSKSTKPTEFTKPVETRRITRRYKEMKQKIAEGLLYEDNSEAESVEHFRRQLASEVARLTELCDTWDKIREQTVLAESVQGEVLGAVGQARLLVSSKLQQFAGLVERCARPEPGCPLITPADLHGFWDIVFMQIENVDMRFKRLNLRRPRGCADEQVSTPARRAARLPRKKQAKPAAASSQLRQTFPATRKSKKGQEEQPAVSLPVTGQPEDSKTFEAGFFSEKSPVRSPGPATPNNKQNYLKAVLSSEAKKASASKNLSSFAMLRASIMSRDLEANGIAPLPNLLPSDKETSFHSGAQALSEASVTSSSKSQSKCSSLYTIEKRNSD